MVYYNKRNQLWFAMIAVWTSDSLLIFTELINLPMYNAIIALSLGHSKGSDCPNALAFISLAVAFFTQGGVWGPQIPACRLAIWRDSQPTAP